MTAVVKRKEYITLSTNHCLNYTNQQGISSEDIALTLDVPNKIIKDFAKLKEQNGASAAPTFTELLNDCIQENAVIVRSERVENRLRILSADVKRKLKGKTGAAYKKLIEGKSRIAIRSGELVNPSTLEKKIGDLTETNSTLSQDNTNLNERCQQIHKSLLETEKTAAESLQKVEEITVDMVTLKERNRKLNEYIDHLEKLENVNSDLNNYKKITEVGKRQRYRKLSELKTRAEKAMWFIKTFGVELDSVNVKDDQGIIHQLCYDARSDSEQKKSYSSLPQHDQDKVNAIMFLLDKFCISEAAYHELTITPDGSYLPKSYLVKQCKENLNAMCHIQRTPGSAPGAELDIMEELRNAIRKYLSRKPDDELGETKIQIKISGDGAKMTRLTNFIILSFSILNEGEQVMSSKGNHTVAVIKEHESYEVLKTSGANIWACVNNLQKEGKISIDGKDVATEIFLGGDYKFLLLAMGMKGATSDFACIWCKIHKKSRYDMSFPINHYWKKEMVRTLQEVKECTKKDKYSCVHKPLMDIPLENVVLDELHLMLRVTDIMTRNLITTALEWDTKDKVEKNKPEKSHLDQLVEAFRECGVSFNVWEKTNADGRNSGQHDFTSLMGSDKKLLLKSLHSKLLDISKPEIGETVARLWKDFHEVYTLMSKWSLSGQEVNEYFEKAQKWICLFLSLNGKAFGHTTDSITPYMHGMVYHVPYFMTRNGGIKKFTGQEYYTPQEQAFIEDQNYSVLKLCKKSEYEIEMSKTSDDSDLYFGLSVKVESNHVVVSHVQDGSASYMSGVLEGDEVLFVNNNEIKESENGLRELINALTESFISLKLRSLREEVPEQVRKTTENIISTLVCPPPPKTSASDDIDVSELIVPPPELGDISQPEEPRTYPSVVGVVSEENGVSVNLLLQSAEEVTSFCRQHDSWHEIEKPTELSGEEKLRKIILELVDTEKNYLKDVQTLLKRYLEPLRQESFLPSEEVNSLVENVSQIIEFQTSFYSEIQQLIECEEDFKNIKDITLFQNVIYGIGEAFLQYADKFKLYSSFCATHSRVIHMLRPGSNVALEEFLDARNPKQQHSSKLESYLIKPIQRILKYPLLLDGMSKLLDKNSEEYHCLSEAISAIEHVAEHINEMQSITEQFLQIFQELARESGSLEVSDVDVDKLLHHKKLTWLNSPETVKANSLRWSPAPLRKMKSESSMRCFVFSKAVILVQLEKRHKKKDKTSKGSLKVSEEINFKTLIPMSSLTLRDNSWSDQDLLNAWELVDVSKTSSDCGQQEALYLLSSRNAEERQETVKTIKDAIRISMIEDSGNLSRRKPSTTSLLSTSSILLRFPGEPAYFRRSFSHEHGRVRNKNLGRLFSAGEAEMYSALKNRR